MKKHSRLGSMAFVGLFAAVAGCAAEDTEPAFEQVEAPVATEAPAASAAPALGDAEVAHVAVTANTIDVETAGLAEGRTENEAVLGFAETMITDHTAVNEQAAALAARLGVTPAANPISQSLQSDAGAVTERLSGLEGAAFDRAYIDHEVAYHQAVLDALDQTLIPSTTNAELEGLLTGVRPAFVAHLEMARSIQSTLPAQ